MSEVPKTTTKEWIALIVPVVLMLGFIVFAINYIWVTNDEMNEFFSSRDITECDKIYETPEDWKPINGTIQEKYDTCADWYKPNGMNDAAIRATDNNKVFIALVISAAIVAPLVLTISVLLPNKDEKNGKEKDTK